MNSLQILMIAPTPFFSNRGCHVRIRGEAQALEKAGHEVKIVTYHLGDKVSELDISRITEVPWYNKRSAGPSAHKLYLDIMLLLLSLKETARFSPDIIHGHLHEGVFIGNFLSLLTGSPLVFDFQGSLTEELMDHGVMKKGGMFFRFAEWIERYCYSAADTILVSSRQGMQTMAERFSTYTEKCLVVPDAVEMGMFKKPLEKPDISGLPDQKDIVVYTGLLNKYQGIDLLLEAIPKVVNEISSTHFLIVGYPNVESYRKKARNLGVGEHITFTGEMEYRFIPYLLSLAEVAVSPKISQSEGNLKLTDYMAAGLPSIVFDNRVNRGLLDEAGYFVEEESSSALAQGIKEVLRNKTLREKLAEKSKKRIRRQFSWNSRIKEIVSIYRKELD